MSIINMKSTVTADNVYGRIARKQDILARINGINNELSGLSVRLSHVEAKLLENKNALSGFSDEYVADHPDAKVRRDFLLKNVSQGQESMDDIKMQMEALKAERQRLKDVDLPDCIQKTGVEEVLAHQDGIKAMKEDAMRIGEAIEAQRAIMVQHESNLIFAPDRSAQRAEILANIAMGEASQKDLDELDALVATERETYEKSVAEAQPIIHRAAETMGALIKREGGLKQQIAAKESETPMVMEQFLLSEITDLASKYVQHAFMLKEAFYSMVALEKLLRSSTGTSRNIIPFALQIPLPGLEEFKELALEDSPDLMVSFKYPWNGDDVIAPWVASERKRLNAAGCQII